jgi:hypothetical protein
MGGGGEGFSSHKEIAKTGEIRLDTQAGWTLAEKAGDQLVGRDLKRDMIN